MDIDKRFEYIIKTLCGGNKGLFAKSIDVSPSVISNVIGKRKGNPSYDVIQKILNTFGHINANWLITGEGDALLTTGNHVAITYVPHKDDPRDMEIITAKNELIKTQRELITVLKHRIKELERTITNAAPNTLPPTSSMTSTGTLPRKTTK